MEYNDILIAPVLTEKSTELREQGKYVFKVAPKATKIQIKEAVRRLFNVKVTDCTVVNVRLSVSATRKVKLHLGKRQP